MMTKCKKRQSAIIAAMTFLCASISAAQSPGLNVLDPVLRFTPRGMDVTLPCIVHTRTAASPGPVVPCAVPGLEWWVSFSDFAADAPPAATASQSSQPNITTVRAGLPWNPLTTQYDIDVSVRRALAVTGCWSAGHGINCTIDSWEREVSVLPDGRLQLRILGSPDVARLAQRHPARAHVTLFLHGVPSFMRLIDVAY